MVSVAKRLVSVAGIWSTLSILYHCADARNSKRGGDYVVTAGFAGFSGGFSINSIPSGLFLSLSMSKWWRRI
ncbi:MAG TPA: hypothetical protein PLI74_10625 [Candidatus Kapabacteria bacterium]|nr:hypothetical protein [Candidatus Kapabacteria bacterium]